MRTGRYIARKRECDTAEGVTLIELLVVLMILGMMAAITVPMFAKGGFFSGNETQLAASELYKLLSASRVYAATYRVKAGLAYGVELKRDSLTGQALEAIDAVAMVYKLPSQISSRCWFYTDMNGNAFSSPQPITGDIYVPITGEQERGFFRTLPGGAVLLAENILPTGSANTALSDTFQPIRVYRVTQLENAAPGKEFAAELVTPLRIADDNTDILGNLPASLQYIAGLPSGAKYLEYQPDMNDAPTLLTPNDFRFPSHIFTPSGRMETSASTVERFVISVGFPPDADPRERFANSTDRAEGLRTKDIELYRGTGRVSIVPEPN